MAANPTWADAGTISLTLRPQATIGNGMLTVQVTVTNSGDEAAQSIVPILRFLDREIRSESQTTLGPNQTLQETLVLPAADLPVGRWPFQLVVDYTDANKYAFQALHVSSVETGSPAQPNVVVTRILLPALSDVGTAHATVKNLTDISQAAGVTVLVPAAFEVGRVPPLELAAWEERTLAIPIVNRAALGGSRYPVFVTVEYEEGTTHQTMIGSGIINVGNPRSHLVEHRYTWWTAAAVLVLLWIAFVLWQRRRSSPAGNHV